ncbi:hypothetical protein MTP06_08950 [Streptomyces sp. PLM4]|nr:hypothetical protein MTP06_08950 [Streptomyces sp. PLM4]
MTGLLLAGLRERDRGPQCGTGWGDDSTGRCGRGVEDGARGGGAREDGRGAEREWWREPVRGRDAERGARGGPVRRGSGGAGRPAARKCGRRKRKDPRKRL